MLTKRDIAIKWTVYGGVSLALLFLHALLLRGVSLWGVTPFLPPVLAGVLSSMEERRACAIYALCIGLWCDLTVAAPFPGLYTVALTLAALTGSFLAANVLQPGLFCAAAVTAVTFAAADVFLILALLFSGAELLPLLSTALRELLISLPLLAVCYPLFRLLNRRMTV